MGLGILLVVILCIIAPIYAGESTNQSQATMVEKRLYRHLIKDSEYNKAVLPVRNPTESVDVSFGVSLISIADLNEANQVLTVSIFEKLNWTDFQLAWDPVDFNNIDSIRVPASVLWIPDIVPYNGEDYVPMFHSAATVTKAGQVFLVSNKRLGTSCSVDLTYFPYDTQVCKIKFGSWTHSDYSLKLKMLTRDPDLRRYVSHHEWDLVKSTGVRTVAYYSCCPDPYVDITFHLKLRRNSGYLTYLFVAPGTMLSLLTPFVFVLPSESGEKVTLGIGLVMAMTFMFFMLEQVIPSSHPTVPLIGYYFAASMITTSVCLATAVAVTSIWYRSLAKRPMPRMLQMLVGIFGRVLFVTREDVTDLGSSVSPRNLEATDGSDKDQIIPHDSTSANASNWRQLAGILDRICFVVFLIAMVAISVKMASRP